MRGLLRRWWVRWIVLPLAVLVGAHAVWTLVLMRRFDARLDELRAAGAPVNLCELAPPPVPEKDNGAALLDEAHRWYEANLAADKPGDLDLDEDYLLQEDLEEIREWLDRADPYVEILARVAAKPALLHDLEWDAGPGMVVVTIPYMYEATVVLKERLRRAERVTPETLRELGILLDLAPRVEPCFVMNLFMRWSMEGIAADAVEQLAAKPGFDAREVRAIVEPRLSGIDERSCLRDVLNGDRVVALSLCRRWIAGEGPLGMVAEANAFGDETVPPGKYQVADTILGSWLARPLAYRDALRTLDLMERTLALVDLPPWQARPRAEALQEEFRAWMPNLFSHLYAVMPTQTVGEWQRYLARVRIARVGLALLEIRDETGHWPATLDLVIPMVGEETVVDPFNGERLRYTPGESIEADVPVPFEGSRVDGEIIWRFP